MTVLDERIRSALKHSVDDVVPARTADEVIDALRRGRRPRRRPTRPARTAALVGAAVLVVGVVGAALAIEFSDRDHPGLVKVGPPVSTAPSVASSAPPPTISTAVPSVTVDGWETLPPAPTPGSVFSTAVWTGEEVVVWGGEIGSTQRPTAEGAAYNPATNRWRALASPPLTARTEQTAVWTGTEMIVCCGSAVGDGDRAAAAYDPRSDTWRELAAPPFESAFATSVWTGKEVLVTGGVVAGGTSAFRGAAAYDPARDTWRMLADPPGTIERQADAAWTGSRLVVWPRSTAGDGGMVYDPATDTWTALPPLPADLASLGGSMVWTGSEIVVWGPHFDGRPGEQVGRAAGARLRLGATTWRAIAAAPIPEFSFSEGTPGSTSAVWTGREMIVVAAGLEPNVGAAVPTLAYDPVSDSWRIVAPASPRWYNPDLVSAGASVLLVSQPMFLLRVGE